MFMIYTECEYGLHSLKPIVMPMFLTDQTIYFLHVVCLMKLISEVMLYDYIMNYVMIFLPDISLVWEEWVEY